jgi:hypothetical protein
MDSIELIHLLGCRREQLEEADAEPSGSSRQQDPGQGSSQDRTPRGWNISRRVAVTDLRPHVVPSMWTRHQVEPNQTVPALSNAKGRAWRGPPEPGIDARTAKSGVNPGVN